MLSTDAEGLVLICATGRLGKLQDRLPCRKSQNTETPPQRGLETPLPLPTLSPIFIMVTGHWLTHHWFLLHFLYDAGCIAAFIVYVFLESELCRCVDERLWPFRIFSGSITWNSGFPNHSSPSFSSVTWLFMVCLCYIPCPCCSLLFSILFSAL